MLRKKKAYFFSNPPKWNTEDLIAQWNTFDVTKIETKTIYRGGNKGENNRGQSQPGNGGKTHETRKKLENMNIKQNMNETFKIKHNTLKKMTDSESCKSFSNRTEISVNSVNAKAALLWYSH